MKKSLYSLAEKREFAREMRAKPTLAETALWFHLRGDKLGYRFHRQSLQWGWILDFYCPALKLGIEVDGSVHELEDQGADDEQKERLLENYGVGLLRFSNEDVLSYVSIVLAQIKAECEAREALKALSGSAGGPTLLSSSSSRPCASGENAVPMWLRSGDPKHLPQATVIIGKTEDTLATAADYAVMRAKFHEIVSARTMWPRTVYCPNQTPEEIAFDQRVRLDEYIKGKQLSLDMPSSVKKLTEMEPEILTFKGMVVEEMEAKKA